MKVTQQNDRILHIDLPGLRLGTMIGVPPRGDDTPVASAVRRALEQVGTLDDAYVHAQRRNVLTPQGLEQHVAGLRADALAAVDELMAGLPKTAQAIAQEREKSFALPPPDATAAATDREWRERFPKLSPTQRDALRGDMRAGRNDALLLALARDAIPTADSQAAMGAWRERVARDKAEELAKWDEQAAEVQWAQSVVGALHGVLTKYIASLGRPPRATAEDLTYGATV